MEEKTEELRDIFMDVAEEETVTERQEEGHGSLADVDDEQIDERLGESIGDMRARFDFETDCETETLTQIVRGFYEGSDDETLATKLDLDPETVFTARMDLHLIGEDDTDAPFSMARMRDLLPEDDTEPDESELAAELDADPDTVEHYRRVAAAQNRARRVSQRFQTAFEDVLADADLTIRLTEGIEDDGLADATEDMDTQVSF